MSIRSGGPRTPEGKKRSSLNALKHGLTARSGRAMKVLAQQCDADYDALLDKVRTHYFPADQLEDALCKRIARCLWRLAQTEAMEQRIFEMSSDRFRPGASYESVLKCDRMVSLEMHRCIRTFARKREAEIKKVAKTNSFHAQPEREFVFEKP